MIICKVDGKEYRKGIKTRVRYPAMTSGYIQYTFCCKKAAEAHVKRLGMFQRNRAKLTKVKS